RRALSSIPFLFFSSYYVLNLDLHSFPTRRSSDLGKAIAELPLVQAVSPVLRYINFNASARSFSVRYRDRTENERALALKLIYRRDRKSTRLNSSHVAISYAVFCLKKKKNQIHARR